MANEIILTQEQAKYIGIQVEALIKHFYTLEKAGVNAEGDYDRTFDDFDVDCVALMAVLHAHNIKGNHSTLKEALADVTEYQSAIENGKDPIQEIFDVNQRAKLLYPIIDKVHPEADLDVENIPFMADYFTMNEALLLKKYQDEGWDISPHDLEEIEKEVYDNTPEVLANLMRACENELIEVRSLDECEGGYPYTEADISNYKSIFANAVDDRLSEAEKCEYEELCYSMGC